MLDIWAVRRRNVDAIVIRCDGPGEESQWIDSQRNLMIGRHEISP
jgi:hypothetical protein